MYQGHSEVSPALQNSSQLTTDKIKMNAFFFFNPGYNSSLLGALPGALILGSWFLNPLFELLIEIMSVKALCKV